MSDTDKTNHYSERYSKLSTEDLKQIAENHDYSEDAQLAVLWELERRNEQTEEQAERAARISAGMRTNRARKQGYRRYKTFFPRLVAAIIDGLAIGAFSMLLYFVFGGDLLYFDETHWTNDLMDGLIVYGYSIFMHGRYGQTVGKMAMSIKVVNYSDESDIGFRQAFMRDSVPVALTALSAFLLLIASRDMIDFETIEGVILFSSFISFFWVMAELLTMLTNDKSRAVHDFIARTVVINTK